MSTCLALMCIYFHFAVQSEEKSDLLQSKNLQASVSKKMSSLEKDEENIKKLEAKVKLLSSQVSFTFLYFVRMPVCCRF